MPAVQAARTGEGERARRQGRREVPRGQKDAATNADDYVRITVYLATVLFLVGISGHFRLQAARYGLVVVGVVVLVLAVATLTTLPGPP